MGANENPNALYSAAVFNDVDTLEDLFTSGALKNIDEPFENGQTCLTTACRCKSAKVARYLLEKGADPNRPNVYNQTALHISVDENDHEVVELLLNCNAAMSKNAKGYTPLDSASVQCHMDVVEVFVRSSAVSRTEKIDGLELLGSMLADRDLTLAFSYLERAMKERHRDPSCVISKPHSILPSRTKLEESKTMEELRARGSDHYTLRLEFLAIALRILGPEPDAVSYQFEAFHGTLQYNHRYAEANDVIFHFVRSAKSGGLSVGYYLKKITSNFFGMIQNASYPTFEDVEEVFELILEELRRGTNSAALVAFLVKPLLCNILVGIKLLKTPDEENRLHLLVETLVRLNLSVDRGQSLLHVAIDPNYGRLRHDEDSNYHLLVSFLVECGADVNAMDNDGNRPLHLLAKVSEPAEHCERLRRSICTLAEAGALVEVRNSSGHTPLDLADMHTAADALRGFRPAPLRSLAATAVLKHRVAFAGRVPELVERYIRLHGTGRNRNHCFAFHLS